MTTSTDKLPTPAAAGHAPSTPRLSIGLPVYNGDAFLAGAIDSLLAQTFTDFELIISDNASTDGTEAICRDRAARDARIRYHRHDINRGAMHNFNHVVELARGEYFKWAAHDDLHEPAFLERCVEALDRQPDSVLAFTQLVDIDDNGVRKSVDLPVLKWDSPHPNVRFRALANPHHRCVPRLVAGGLVLVPAVAGDLDWLLGLLILPDVRRYLCDDRVFTREEVAGMLAETLALPDGLGMWRIEIDPGARAVFIALHPVSETTAAAMPAFAGEVEPTVALDPRHWDRGHAGAALRTVTTYAFDTLGLTQVVAMVDEPNERSHRMIARAGYDPVGTCQGPANILRCYRKRRPS